MAHWYIKIAVFAITLSIFGVKLSAAQAQCDSGCSACSKGSYTDKTSKNDDDVIKFYCAKGRS